MTRKPYEKTKPFRPYVTLQQMVAFDSKRPETYTKSPLVNEVLTALEPESGVDKLDMAHYLHLTPADLSACLRVATGMNYKNLRIRLFRARLQILRDTHPELSAQQMAERLGYASRTAVWRADGGRSPRNTVHTRDIELLRRAAEKDPEMQPLYERLKKKYKL